MIERSRSTPLPSLATHRRQRGLTQRQLGELASVAHHRPAAGVPKERSLLTDPTQACHRAKGSPRRAAPWRETPTLRGTPLVQRVPSSRPCPNTLPRASRKQAIDG
jgi:hypothetical protein